MQVLRVVAAHDHCERIVEAERWHHFHFEPRAILLFHATEYFRGIFLERIVQNRSERRARIFRIEIDLSRNERIMAYECPAEIQPPFHAQSRMRFDLLRKQLRENY